MSGEKNTSKKAGRNRTSLTGTFEKKAPIKKFLNRETAQRTRALNFLIPGAAKRMRDGFPGERVYVRKTNEIEIEEV